MGGSRDESSKGERAQQSTEAPTEDLTAVPTQSEVPLWSVNVTYCIGAEIGSPDEGAIQRLDVSKHSSVSKAVEALNSGDVKCDSGLCIVYSDSHMAYFLLIRSDKKDEGARAAQDIFNVNIEKQNVVQ